MLTHCSMPSIRPHNFTPDLVLISAGFDSLTGDPLGAFTTGSWSM